MTDTANLPEPLQFVPPGMLLDGQGQHTVRFEQAPAAPADHRPLSEAERQRLIAQNNTADDWRGLWVTDDFDASAVRNCRFEGLVRLGKFAGSITIEPGCEVQAGLLNSRIVDCDIADGAAVHDVKLLARCIVEPAAAVVNVGQCYTTPSARFGWGNRKHNQVEADRLTLAVVNENARRAIPPYPRQTPAEAQLLARYRADEPLQRGLLAMIDAAGEARWGRYSRIGKTAVVRNTPLLIDVDLGPHGRIDGAAEVRSVSIDSSAEEPSRIGPGAIVRDGVLGVGCKIDSAATAIRFVLGPHAQLERAARVIDTYLGPNSHVACCEVTSCLILGSHQQHHNDSMLLASLVAGQSNVAAGATIGSNHNSRAPDGEIHAARGFWPGLCVSLKHPCRFAAFTLIAKGDYPSELDIRLPLSLLSNDAAGDRLVVIPAYWLMYNAYALGRNAWKFAARDRRKSPLQRIECDWLAPDVVEQMLDAMDLLELWTAKALLRARDENPDDKAEGDLRKLGRRLLCEDDSEVDRLDVRGEMVENSRRPVAILKARPAWRAYRAAANFFAVRELLDADAWPAPSAERWTNLGGQIIASGRVKSLRAAVVDGQIATLDDLRRQLIEIDDRHTPADRAALSGAVLTRLHGPPDRISQWWPEAIDQAEMFVQDFASQILRSRQKDFAGHFRTLCCETEAEFRAVLGRAEDDSFVNDAQAEAKALAERIGSRRNRVPSRATT